MDKYEAKLIVLFARNNMNCCKTSTVAYCHRNTIRYHFAKIRKRTGLDPCNFFDLQELYTMAFEVLGGDFEL